MDSAEKMAADIALAMNGGEWKDGKWYSKGHREAWIKAVQPYADEIERLRETIANAAQLNARLMDIIHLAKRMKTAAFNHWCEKTPETNGILVDLQFEFEDALEGLKKDGYFSFRPSTKGE